MVAEGSSARVTAFPGGEGQAGARRLLDLLVSLADEGGTWRGSQADLATRLGVHPRTVVRYVSVLRSRGYIVTSGRTGNAYEYALLARPRQDHTPPTPIRSGVIASITPPVTGPDATPDSQIQPRAGAAPQSSSSSGSGQADHTPLPIRGPDQGSPGSGDGGGLDGPRELTARGEILARFHAEPTEHMARTWAGLGERGRAIAADKMRRWPSTKDPSHPPPTYLAQVFDTAAQLERADDLASLLPEADVVGAASPPAAPIAPRQSSSWWRPLVVPAAIVCAAILLTRRGGK